VGRANERHGHTTNGRRSSTYRTWEGMIRRCDNPNASNYEDYGERGIRVCDRWHDFMNFLEDMGERPDGKTLDRYPDCSGDYSPENCRWASWEEQQNNRSNTRWIEFNGERLSLTMWARRTGLSRDTIRGRLDRLGWSVEKALTTPVRSRKGGKKTESTS
jgi:hypothetical protein